MKMNLQLDNIVSFSLFAVTVQKIINNDKVARHSPRRTTTFGAKVNLMIEVAPSSCLVSFV